MKNYIEGLKEVKGGGDLQDAQNTIERCFPYEVAQLTEDTTIETIEELAIGRLKNIFERFEDDVKFLQLKTTEQQNKHYTEYYERDYKKYDELLDACYCIEWTKNHQPRTITEIMNDYRATKKTTQKDFDTLRNSGSFSTNEIENIMLGLPVGTDSECIPVPKIKV